MRTQSMLAGLAVLLVGVALVKRHQKSEDEQSKSPRAPGRFKPTGPGTQPDPHPPGTEMQG
jgi:hypothetical protein